jgi:hypothetical protein
MFQSILPGGQFEGCRLGIFDQLAVVPWFCPGASQVECGFATYTPKMKANIEARPSRTRMDRRQLDFTSFETGGRAEKRNSKVIEDTPLVRSDRLLGVGPPDSRSAA